MRMIWAFIAVWVPGGMVVAQVLPGAPAESPMHRSLGALTIAFVLVVACIVALLVLLYGLQARSRVRRRREVQVVARRLGYQFFALQGSGGFPSGWARPELAAMLNGFWPFGQGFGRVADNVVVVEKGERTFYLFDYTFSTGRISYACGIAAVRVPLSFKGLVARPEGSFDRLGEKDLQFDSQEFNRRYRVTAVDEKFARELIHPGLIEYLMRIEPRQWQLAGPYLVIARIGIFKTAQFDEVIEDIDGFLDLIPEKVRKEIGFGPTWTTLFTQ